MRPELFIKNSEKGGVFFSVKGEKYVRIKYNKK